MGSVIRLDPEGPQSVPRGLLEVPQRVPRGFQEGSQRVPREPRWVAKGFPEGRQRVLQRAPRGLREDSQRAASEVSQRVPRAPPTPGGSGAPLCMEFEANHEKMIGRSTGP